ncbi:hypothetical protein QBC36DRAFT_111808 [Triangularia setosa]|uniref:Secreted protein n=1 Tax=Triangularia setosa TaxID=2587417 RepID=A0AAN7A7F7_9PEZI|nr:hypothetical protein QBC36DRAFT_111808 [Podospora setosa]
MNLWRAFGGNPQYALFFFLFLLQVSVGVGENGDFRLACLEFTRLCLLNGSGRGKGMSLTRLATMLRAKEGERTGSQGGEATEIRAKKRFTIPNPQAGIRKLGLFLNNKWRRGRGSGDQDQMASSTTLDRDVWTMTLAIAPDLDGFEG